MPGGVHPFARHRDQPPLRSDADIAAHFVRALAKGAGLGLQGQFKHVLRIGRAQRHDVRIVRGAGVAAGGDHLVNQAHRLGA
ncbi:hypothetical protein D3C72_1620100 [compost metagenome]